MLNRNAHVPGGTFVSKLIGKPTFPREFPGVHYYDGAEEEAALRVIRNHSPFRYYGASFLAEADNLEKEFAQILGRSYAQAVASGTSGLAASLAALEIGPGQEVLIPGFMWVATVGTVVRSGAIPVLVEMDDTFNMDPTDLDRKITPRSSLIVSVHMCGVPCNMPAINQVAKSHGLKVLEDCAQANGGSFGGKKVGTFGDMAVFSFQMNKNITAGEGGIVVTDDERCYLRANAAQDLGVPWKGGMPVQDSDISLWGQGTRMSELTAAVVRAQLPKLPRIVSAMRSSKQRIKAAVADLPGISFRRVLDPDGDTGPFIITLFGSPATAAAFAAAAAEIGLPATHMPNYGLHIYYNIKALVEKRSNSPDGYPWTHPANADLIRDYSKDALPATDALLDRAVALPVPSMMDEEMETTYIELFRDAARRSDDA